MEHRFGGEVEGLGFWGFGQEWGVPSTSAKWIQEILGVGRYVEGLGKYTYNRPREVWQP